MSTPTNGKPARLGQRVKFDILKPAEAPPGIRRLLPLLQESLAQTDYTSCRIIVAFARMSGIARLLPSIRGWRGRGNTIEAIVGIDQWGTSVEALQVMLDELDSVYITRTDDPTCTFHPKMYLFQGKLRARSFIGSHNLSLGGLETNYEGGIIIDLELPDEDGPLTSLLDAWNQLLPGAHTSTRKLESALLEELERAHLILPERRIAQRSASGGQNRSAASVPGSGIFPRISPAPPSPLPKDIVPGFAKRKKTAGRIPVVEEPRTIEGLPRGFVIEIIPHHNGEIFLSKRAADAFPAFFGMPFTGRTVPKSAGNPGYPMRVPDPVVEWRLYDRTAKLTHRSQFNLNTVLYEEKSEIRITVTPSLGRLIPEYSVMVMWGGSSLLPAGLDYVIEVHVPGSPGQRRWEPTLNLTLPSGGKARSRRMGWI